MPFLLYLHTLRDVKCPYHSSPQPTATRLPYSDQKGLVSYATRAAFS